MDLMNLKFMGYLLVQVDKLWYNYYILDFFADSCRLEICLLQKKKK